MVRCRFAASLSFAAALAHACVAGCGGLTSGTGDSGAQASHEAMVDTQADAGRVLDASRDASMEDRGSSPDVRAEASPGCPAGLVTLATGDIYPSAIAVDVTNVYFASLTELDGSAATLISVPKCGGVATTLASQRLGRLIVAEVEPFGIAVDSTSLYWTNSAAFGTVMKVALSGGTPTTLASGQSRPSAIAVDSASVYWTNEYWNPLGFDPQEGSVVEEVLSGGAPVTLASAQNPGNGIALSGASVYWVEALPDAVAKTPTGGGGLTTLASGLDNPLGIAADSDSVYWTNNIAPAEVGASSVMRVASGGGAPVTLSLTGGDFIALDDKSVYWTSTDAGTLMKVGKDGGTTITLTSTSGPGNIAVDEGSVYWVELACPFLVLNDGGACSGAVKRLTPK